jgi:hypothetical protein
LNDTNPVVMQGLSISAVIVVVKAFLVYSRAMNWLDLNEEQEAATITFLDTVLPIVAVWVGVLWAKRRVTPLNNPVDLDGVPLSRPGDKPTIPQMESIQKEAIKINERINERGL